MTVRQAKKAFRHRYLGTGTVPDDRLRRSERPLNLAYRRSKDDYRMRWGRWDPMPAWRDFE